MSDKKKPNIPGNISLGLGIVSIVSTWLGMNYYYLWRPGLSPLDFTLPLGFIGFLFGIAGLFGRKRPRTTAVVGLILGLSGVCLYLIILIRYTGQ